MQRDAFRDWATGPGGLTERVARLHLDNLIAVERLLSVDLDDDYPATRLRDVQERIGDLDRRGIRTGDGYGDSVVLYEQFRSLTGA